MGNLGCLFAWMHPVRHLSRRARRAVTPRPIRRALRAKNQVIHPIESVERSAFRAIDRAVTPRKPRPKSQPSPPVPVPPAENATMSDHATIDSLATGPRSNPAQLRIDPLFADAARLIAHRQWVSVSWLMKRLDISYSRAGRIMDQLEHHHIVSPYIGAKERYIMMPAMQIDELVVALDLAKA